LTDGDKKAARVLANGCLVFGIGAIGTAVYGAWGLDALIGYSGAIAFYLAGAFFRAANRK